MNIGTLTIEMATNIARLQKDMSEAKTVVDSSMKAISASVDVAKKAFIGLTGLASVAAFKGMIDEVIEGKVQLQRLSEQTGATVESLSAIGAISKYTGTNIADVSSAINKMQKNLASSNEDSKGAATALKAVGIEFDTFKNMKPDEQMLTIAKALDKFQDGGGKAAFMMMVMGKAGAQLLPLMKELAEKQELVGKTTKESAAEAEQYEKSLKQLDAAGQAWKRTMVDAILPTLAAVTKAMVEARKEGGLLASVQAGIQTLFTGNDQYKNDKALVEQVDALGALEKGLANFRAKGFKEDNLGIVSIKEQIASMKEQLQTTQAYRKVLAETTDAEEKRAEVRAKNGGVPLSGSSRGAPATGVDPGLALLDSLKTKIEQLTGSTSEYEIVLRKLDGMRKEISPAERKEIENKALLVDQLEKQAKAVAEVAKYQQIVIAAQEKAVDEYYAATGVLQQLGEAQAFEVQQLGKLAPAIELARFQRDLNNKTLVAESALVNRGMQEGWDEIRMQEERAKVTKDAADALRSFGLVQADAADKLYNPDRGMKDALDEYAQHVREVGTATKNIMTNAFKGMEDALVSFVTTGKLDFKSLANSIIADMVRMQVQQSIMQPFAAGFKNGGGLGGGLSGLWNSIKGLSGAGSYTGVGGATGAINTMGFGGRYATGGRPPLGMPSLVGERGPELFVPDSAGTVIPNGLGGKSVTLSTTINIDSRSDRAAVYADVSRAMADNNKRFSDQLRQQGVLA